MEVKKYARYLCKYAEPKILEVESTDISKLIVPKNIISISTFTKIFETVNYNGEEIVLVSKEIDPKFYYVGEYYSEAEIAKFCGKESNLYQNIIRSNAIGCVMSPNGLTFSAIYKEEEKDLIIPLNGIHYENEDENE